MENLLNAVPVWAPYHPAMLVLAMLCLIALCQSLLCAPLAFINGGQVPGAPTRHDDTHLSFRALRTYANTVENLPAFTGALLAAIIAGVGAVLVNWLAVLHLACRLAYWAFYYAGIGKHAGGPRTIAYLGGVISNMVLVAAAIYALV
ncbi:MAPEG family protein [Actibacterium sp. 188UL27-1]|uniref:MAPEG family protein n=1 Tax=Actibacterium sp. 188UL27-1 TaxID=2786961 RepID=UPI001958EDD3|nr:MAPEG family protein [Actibacterium sp. 188UL27-1]MBM7070153.1 MAPEG family protein [Actibacterium sp. 188UL27-1]